VNDHSKPQNDTAQQDERARELIVQLEAIDRRITPEHVVRRFHELLDGIADNGLATPLPAATDDGMTARRSDTAGARPAEAVHSTGTAKGTSSGGTLVADDPGSLQGSQGALFEADQVPGISEVSHEADAESAEIGYRGPTACAAAGITYRQLDYWARTSLVEPSVRTAHGSGSQRLYSFRDILVLKVVKRLLDTGISLQQIRAAVQHLRDRGTEDLARVTLMSDGVSVYECTSADEVVDLLQGGEGVFGIALGRVWREVEGDLAVLPAVRAEDGFVEECAPFDVEAGAAQLRRAAEARGLLSQREPAHPIGNPRAGEVRDLPGVMASDSGVRRIVVGVDGSAESVAALRWACMEASLRAAEVHAVLALESAVHQVASYAVPSPKQSGGSWGAARDVLRRAVSEAAGLYPGVSIRAEVTEGLAARVLLDHAAGADMLVLGGDAHRPDPSRGAGPVIRVCLRAARCPVVLISAATQVAPEGAVPGPVADEPVLPDHAKSGSSLGLAVVCGSSGGAGSCGVGPIPVRPVCAGFLSVPAIKSRA